MLLIRENKVPDHFAGEEKTGKIMKNCLEVSELTVNPCNLEMT